MMRKLLLLLVLSVYAYPVLSGENCGHDHGHDHDHAENAQLTNQLNRMGIKVEMIQDRLIGGKDVIAMPVGAVVTENGNDYVFIQNEENPMKFDRHEVRLGISDGMYVEAISGVFPGDNVAIRGSRTVAPQPGLHDGPSISGQGAPQSPPPSVHRYAKPPAAPAYGYRSIPKDDYIVPQSPGYQAPHPYSEQREPNRYRSYRAPQYAQGSSQIVEPLETLRYPQSVDSSFQCPNHSCEPFPHGAIELHTPRPMQFQGSVHNHGHSSRVHGHSSHLHGHSSHHRGHSSHHHGHSSHHHGHTSHHH